MRLKSIVGFGWRMRNSCSVVTSRTAKGASSQSFQIMFPSSSARRNASAKRIRSLSRRTGFGWHRACDKANARSVTQIDKREATKRQGVVIVGPRFMDDVWITNSDERWNADVPIVAGASKRPPMVQLLNDDTIPCRPHSERQR